MDFKIPAKFQLGGSTITVDMVKQVTGEGSAVDGMAIYAKRKIELRQDTDVPVEYTEFVFFHELLHHIFDAMGENKMRENEKLVNQMALLLHQSIKTME